MMQLVKTTDYFPSINILPRKEPHKKLIILCGIFGAVAVALSLLELNVVVLVLLYSDLFLLAVCLSVLILSGTTLTEDPIIRKRNTDSRSVPYRPRNRVNSFSIYVEYAAKGSDFSRREIAVTLKRILVQKLGTAPNSTSLYPELSEDLGRVVFPYVSDLVFAPARGGKSSGAGSEFETLTKAPSGHIEDRDGTQPLKRQAYLASVERVIAKLQTLG